MGDALGSICLRNELKPFYREHAIEAYGVRAGCHLRVRGHLMAGQQHLGGDATDVQTAAEAKPEIAVGSESAIVTWAIGSLSLCGDEDEADLEAAVRSHELQRIASAYDSSGNLQLPSGEKIVHRQRRRIRRPAYRKLRAATALHRLGQPSLKAFKRAGEQPSLRSLMRSDKADPAELQMLIARRELVKSSWTGVVSNASAYCKRSPKLKAAFAETGLFDGGHKLNQERGNACRGQGKRHQNAAVHAQPKRNQGRLAKWCSGRPKPNAAQDA